MTFMHLELLGKHIKCKPQFPRGERCVPVGKGAGVMQPLREVVEATLSKEELIRGLRFHSFLFLLLL